MALYNFIFSNRSLYRFSRHLVFWALYCFYFWAQSINPMNYDEFFKLLPYKYAFINLCCFMPVCILSVYLFIYVLLPAFLKKRYYALFALAFISWFAVAVLINYFAAGIFLNNIRYSNYIAPDFVHKSNFSYANTVWAITIALLALGIKLTKNWYLQQKENLDIIQRKARTELSIEKAFIQPDFLFRSLDSISSKIDYSPDEPPLMILKLSDLLSYSLYQDELVMVPLERELTCLKDLIFLEQNNFSRFSNIDVELSGDITNKYVPPMIILALVQESVTLLSRDNLESYHVNCQINIQNNHLHVKKTFSGSQKNKGSDAGWLSIIDNAKNRLSTFFPQTEYQVGITEENGKTIITLNMPVPASPYVQDVKTHAQPKSTFYEPT